MSGQNIGYIRVSTVDQNTARQLDGLQPKLDKIFTDRVSGKSTDRPELQACLSYVREGDVLHVHSMDRLARNLEDLLRIVRQLNEKGVVVQFHKPELKFSGEADPIAHLTLQLLGAFAAFERNLLLERQREGIAIAKAEGRYRGGKPKLQADQVAALIARVTAGVPKARVAREFSISRETLYTYLERHHVQAQPAPA